MDRHYSFNGMTIRLSCADGKDPLFNHLSAMFSSLEEVKGASHWDCAITVSHNEGDLAIPEGATRSSFLEYERSFDLNGLRIFLFRGRHMITADPERMALSVEYRAITDFLNWDMEKALVWLISSVSMKGNSCHVEANMVRLNGKTSLVFGRMHLGRRKMALMMLKLDRNSAFHNYILSDSELCLMPLFIPLGIDPRIAHAFQSFDPRIGQQKFPFERIDSVIIARKWNHSSSDFIKLDPEAAIPKILDLVSSNNKFFYEEEIRRMESLYRGFFAKSKFYEFYSGDDADSLPEAFLRMIGGDSALP